MLPVEGGGEILGEDIAPQTLQPGGAKHRDRTRRVLQDEGKRNGANRARDAEIAGDGVESGEQCRLPLGSGPGWKSSPPPSGDQIIGLYRSLCA